MKVSMHVVGIIPPDERWRQMKAVHDACRAAKCAPPKEVTDFFQGELPDDAGVVVSKLGNAMKEYAADMDDGYTIDLSKLPKDVKFLRFTISY